MLTNENNQNEDKTQSEQQTHKKEKIDVTVDGKPRTVEAGSYIVSDFKELVHVEASRVLEELIDKKFTPLDDTATVVIEGGEIFTSHVRRGGSSWK
ncbi:MAG: hypothetical protein H0X25_08985 [Acidobacteriales bacterium]|nr:hypothetical protein [Terriglobales bacterium]